MPHANKQGTIRRTVLACLMMGIMMGILDQAKGAEYFVATTGSDANAGTQSAPFKTIQAAADRMVAGDTCYIRAGTYRETAIPTNSGSAGAPITFAAYGNEKVVVSGTDVILGPWNAYNQKDRPCSIYAARMPWSLGPGKDMLFVDGNVVIQARWPKSNTALSVPPRPPNLPPLWMTFGDFRVLRNSSEVANPTDLNQNQQITGREHFTWVGTNGDGACNPPWSNPHAPAAWW